MNKTKAQIRAEMEALIAGKTPTRCETGAKALGMTDRQWYRAARDVQVQRVVEDHSIEEAISEREHEIGAAHGVEGVNDFRIGLRRHGAKAMLGWE